MPRLTNEHLHSEIKLVKNDVSHLRDGQQKMQDDITMIKKVLAAIWSVWIVMIGILGKMIFWD